MRFDSLVFGILRTARKKGNSAVPGALSCFDVRPDDRSFDVFELNHIPLWHVYCTVSHSSQTERTSFHFSKHSSAFVRSFGRSFIHAFGRSLVYSFTSPPFQRTTTVSAATWNTRVKLNETWGKWLACMNEIRVSSTDCCICKASWTNALQTAQRKIICQCRANMKGRESRRTHTYSDTNTYNTLGSFVLVPYCRGVLNQNRSGIRCCVLLCPRVWFNFVRLHHVTDSFPKSVVVFRRVCTVVRVTHWN